MSVKKGSSVEADAISYLKFDVGSSNKKEVSGAQKVQKAILNLYGANPSDSIPFTFHLYGITENSWSEATINWNNSPAHDPAGAKATGVGAASFPIGAMTLEGSAGYTHLDVTDFVNRQLASGHIVSFMLVREYRYDGDSGDQSRQAVINTKESRDNHPSMSIDY
jgi:hypothetical protein